MAFGKEGTEDFLLCTEDTANVVSQNTTWDSGTRVPNVTMYKIQGSKFYQLHSKEILSTDELNFKILYLLECAKVCLDKLDLILRFILCKVSWSWNKFLLEVTCVSLNHYSVSRLMSLSQRHKSKTSINLPWGQLGCILILGRNNPTIAF